MKQDFKYIMENQITERIALLRSKLSEKNISAFIIPSTDPHLSEYVSSCWKSRAWISGFTGSAGTVVITSNNAGLWTDSRYFIQAEQQLSRTGIQLFKDGLPSTPSINEWLVSELSNGSSVGVDGKMFSVKQIEEMKLYFSSYEINLVTSFDPISLIWDNRPEIPSSPAFVYDIEYAGVSCIEKIAMIRAKLNTDGADGLLVSALDEIAWTLNIRGCDVKCNPVVISYLLISKDSVSFFIDRKKLTDEVVAYLSTQNISIFNYSDINSALSKLNLNSISLNPDKTNYDVYSAINPSCRVVSTISPISLLKAVKNSVEVNGIRSAMLRDGVALVHFLKWLEEAVPNGKETEITIDHKLHDYRAAQELYKGESFDTIAGYKEHGAIVHYSATPESASTLSNEGFLLLDSGAQYLDGTTDITRTIALGNLTDDEKLDYTLVLKGHIALASCKFPYGTRGAQLDILARNALWQRGMNYLHGTGHGVGCFLSVHEGPQSIRLNEVPILLLPGMITSNEPGIYKSGRYGIRIENLLVVNKDVETEFGEFYKFETVTLCPICTKGIVKSILSTEEIIWLNDYHQMVFNKLAPFIDEVHVAWLREKTRAI